MKGFALPPMPDPTSSFARMDERMDTLMRRVDERISALNARLLRVFPSEQKDADWTGKVEGLIGRKLDPAERSEVADTAEMSQRCTGEVARLPQSDRMDAFWACMERERRGRR